MNEKVENLILEHLRPMRGDISGIRDDISTLRAEMTSVRQHLGGVISLQEHDHGDIATIKTKLDRVEERLDLVDD